MESVDQQALANIFFPYAIDEINKAKKKQSKFVHYTSASVAISILDRKEVWLRNARLMNDFSEIRYGQTCLQRCWQDNAIRDRLKNALDQVDGDLFNKVTNFLNNMNEQLAEKTYIMSLSRHGVDEDKHGRLSMWRAYGGDTSVALVFDQAALLSESLAIPVFSSPVLYADLDRFKAKFQSFVGGIEENVSLLKAIEPQRVLDLTCLALTFAVQSTKHPGFKEEQEWRLIHHPLISQIYFDGLVPEGRVKFDLKEVGGVPQKVCLLPLKNYPEQGFFGAEIPQLIDKIIIGPTHHPQTIREAMIERLEACGVSEAEQVVIVSEIPLRR